MYVREFTIIPTVISANSDRQCLIGIPLRILTREKVSCQISTRFVAYTKYHTTVLTVRNFINFIMCSYRVQDKHTRIWMQA
jgi:hypothetical protein